jgi:hypothetical protein
MLLNSTVALVLREQKNYLSTHIVKLVVDIFKKSNESCQGGISFLKADVRLCEARPIFRI